MSRVLFLQLIPGSRDFGLSAFCDAENGDNCEYSDNFAEGDNSEYGIEY